VPVVLPVAVTVQAQARAQVQAGTVLRYVENRRVMTSGEAERQIEEIVSNLFPYKKD
jgi:type IV pilus biogenesis protein CpaD/CtpE